MQWIFSALLNTHSSMFYKFLHKLTSVGMPWTPPHLVSFLRAIQRMKKISKIYDQLRVRALQRSVHKKKKRVLTWWDGCHDLLSFVSIVNLEGKKILWSSQLEFGSVCLLVLLDGNSISVGKMILLSSHNLNEFL